MNLVTHIPERLEFVAKLLIPAINCANFDFTPSGGAPSLAQTQAQYWTLARGVTLSWRPSSRRAAGPPARLTSSRMSRWRRARRGRTSARATRQWCIP